MTPCLQARQQPAKYPVALALSLPLPEAFLALAFLPLSPCLCRSCLCLSCRLCPSCPVQASTGPSARFLKRQRPLVPDTSHRASCCTDGGASARMTPYLDVFVQALYRISVQILSSRIRSLVSVTCALHRNVSVAASSAFVSLSSCPLTSSVFFTVTGAGRSLYTTVRGQNTTEDCGPRRLMFSLLQLR